MMDESTRDLLRTIHDAVSGVADWRCVAVTSAVQYALATGNPGGAADDLRDFLAERKEVTPSETP